MIQGLALLQTGGTLVAAGNCAASLPGKEVFAAAMGRGESFVKAGECTALRTWVCVSIKRYHNPLLMNSRL